MSLMYRGDTDETDGGCCMCCLHWELIVTGAALWLRKQLYGVCDNQVYAYDVMGMHGISYIKVLFLHLPVETGQI